MIEYANESVVKSLKQYEMLSKSLNFTVDLKQKQEICYQMTRIIQKVLNLTNKVYEEKYLKIVNRSTYLMDEEKNRLLELINLINERRTYVNNQISNNIELTGIDCGYEPILGEDKLDYYKSQVKIIEKYKNNIKLDSVLKDEITDLEKNIKKANEKINTNKFLNKQLEDKMIKLLEKSFNKLGLYELQEREKEIDLAYTELGYSLEKAKENAKIARKDCSPEIILECDNMLASITLEYERYKEKKLILKLIEIYKNPVQNYEELLKKREEINNILTGITSSELYLEVGTELTKEYATIKLEKQDMTTLKSLIEEKENKTRTLKDINEENESEEFKGILSTLLENEKRYQEKLSLEKKKKEEEEKARRLEEAKRKHKEMIKRQKALEEERKKEIEERTKQLLVEKKNPILFNNPTQEKNSDTTNTTPPKDIKTKPSSGSTLSKKAKIEENSYSSNTKSIPTRSDRLNNKSINVKPSDDIFSREKRNTRKVDEGIPVIKNSNIGNEVVSSETTKKQAEVFPKAKLNKEENIFPTMPNQKNDSFFDEEEFKDLNKFMEEDKKSNWF